MSISIPGLSASTKTPAVYLNVILGGPGTSAGAAPETILLVGNILESAISINPGSPTIEVAAGFMALATPTFCASVGDALTLCGQGSELHRMARAVFAQYPAASLYLAANAESAGATATASGGGSPAVPAVSSPAESSPAESDPAASNPAASIASLARRSA